jgi:hypothetical protein
MLRGSLRQGLSDHLSRLRDDARPRRPESQEARGHPLTHGCLYDKNLSHR